MSKITLKGILVNMVISLVLCGAYIGAKPPSGSVGAPLAEVFRQ